MVATVTVVFERPVHNVATGEISDNDSVFPQEGGISRGSETTSSSTK
jgi:hypothetical protein